MTSSAHWREVCYRYVFSVGLGFGVLAITPFLSGQEAPPPTGDLNSDEVETLTRGPIHEAFASPSTTPEEPLVVAKAPPEAIDEVPPDYRPEGEDVIWIPGYWAWDDERSDFFWISGVWRERPPGQRWVPGYWTEVDGGFQWVAGFWIGADVTELSYQPAPPASLEEGPSSPSPSEEHFWIPGYWNYGDSGYRWQAGYWAPYRADWVWTPACYYYTPSGCVFTSGFWDYRFSRRGQLFAPVYFNQPIYRTAGYRFTPRISINAGNLFVNLWIRPNYCHYYYGDYYGQQYTNWNFTPWYQAGISRRYYDPLWAHSRCHYGLQGIDYASRMRGWHDYYARHKDHRPPHTYRDQIRLAQRDRGNTNKTIINQNLIGADFRQVVTREGNKNRFHHLDNEQRQRYTSLSREFQDLNRERRQVERRDAVANRDDKGAKGNRDPGRDGKRPGKAELPTLKLPQQVVTRRPVDDGSESKPQVPPRPDRRDTARDDDDRGPGNAGKGQGRPGRDFPSRPGDTAIEDAGQGRDKAGSDKVGGAKSRLPGSTPNEAGGSAFEQRMREARERAGKAGKLPGDNVGGDKNRPSNGAFNDERGPTLEQRIREARERAAGKADTTPGTRGPDNSSKLPGVEMPRGPKLNPSRELPKLDRPANPRPDATPGIRTPGSSPRLETPRTETRRPEIPRSGTQLPGIDRSGTPRTGSPRFDTPTTPRINTPNTSRPDAPRTESRRIDTGRPLGQTPGIADEYNRRRAESSRATTPRSLPRFEPSQPRVSQPQPRISTPQPRISTPQPRVSQPQPRISTPQPRVSQPQPRVSQPRIDRGSRPQADRGNSGNRGNNSDRGKGNDSR